VPRRRGRRGGEERLATVCTIGLESLFLSPLLRSLSFSLLFSSLSRAHPPFSRSFPASTLHHSPRSFLVSCNLCLEGARWNTYAFSQIAASRAPASPFLFSSSSISRSLQSDVAALHEVRFHRQRVSLSPSPSICPRWLVYHAPFSRLIKRPES